MKKSVSAIVCESSSISANDIKKIVNADSDKSCSIKDFAKLASKVAGIDEDSWVTMRGTHVLVDNDGSIKNDNFRKKIEATSSKKSSGKKSVEAKSGSVSKSDPNKKHKDNIMNAVKSGSPEKALSYMANAIKEEDNKILKELKNDEIASNFIKSPKMLKGFCEISSDIDKVTDEDLKEELNSSELKFSDKHIKDLRKSLEVIKGCNDAIENLPDDEDDLGKVGENLCSQLDNVIKLRNAQRDIAKVMSDVIKNTIAG